MVQAKLFLQGELQNIVSLKKPYFFAGQGDIIDV